MYPVSVTVSIRASDLLSVEVVLIIHLSDGLCSQMSVECLKHLGNKHSCITANGHPSKPNLSPFRCASGFSSVEPAKIPWSRWRFSICYHGWRLSVLQHSQVTKQMVGCWKCCWNWAGSHPALFGPDELVQAMQQYKCSCKMSKFLCGRTGFFFWISVTWYLMPKCCSDEENGLKTIVCILWSIP